MLTKNAKRMLAAAFIMPDVDTYLTKSFIPIVNILNATKYAALTNERWPAKNNYNLLVNLTNGTSWGIGVGSGNTAATEDDYNLESLLNYTQITGYTSVLSIDMVSGNPTIEILVSIKNITGSALTVSEIGCFARVMSSSTAGSSTWADTTMLIERSVLSNPVTIPAGGTANITYTITGDLS